MSFRLLPFVVSAQDTGVPLKAVTMYAGINGAGPVAFSPDFSALYVVDISNRRFVRFASDGSFSRTIPIYLDCSNIIDAVAIDDEGHLYTDGVCKLAANGSLLARFNVVPPTYPPPPSHLIFGLAMDSSGCLYVVDYTDERVVRLLNNGTVLSSFSVAPMYTGTFNHYLAVDSHLSVYYSWENSIEVRKYSVNGTRLATFSTPISRYNSLNVLGIAVDPFDALYMFTSDRNYPSSLLSIFKLDSNGRPVANFTLPTPNASVYRTSFTVDRTGSVYVPLDDEVTVFDITGRVQRHLRSPLPSMNSILGLAVDSAGAMYVSSRSTSNLYKLSPEGTTLLTIPQPRWTHGVAVDDGGLIYTTDYVAGLVHVYGADGTPVSSIGAANPPLNGPTGVAVDAHHSVFVADANNSRVVRFNATTGLQLATFQLPSTGTALLQPSAVAVDIAGNVYVADAGNYRIVKFAPDGSLLLSFPTGKYNQLSLGPQGVHIDADGRILVVNRDAVYHVEVFDANGRRLYYYFSLGFYTELRGIAIDPTGRILVAGGHAVLVLATGTPFVSSTGSAAVDGATDWLDKFAGERTLIVGGGVVLLVLVSLCAIGCCWKRRRLCFSSWQREDRGALRVGLLQGRQDSELSSRL
jgi:sugar lactone lactonase YvrE